MADRIRAVAFSCHSASASNLTFEVPLRIPGSSVVLPLLSRNTTLRTSDLRPVIADAIGSSSTDRGLGPSSSSSLLRCASSTADLAIGEFDGVDFDVIGVIGEGRQEHSEV